MAEIGFRFLKRNFYQSCKCLHVNKYDCFVLIFNIFIISTLFYLYYVHDVCVIEFNWASGIYQVYMFISFKECRIDSS